MIGIINNLLYAVRFTKNTTVLVNVCYILPLQIFHKENQVWNDI